jgi:MtfA peptidase
VAWFSAKRDSGFMFVVAYMIFYGAVALAMLLLTEAQKSIRIFAEKYLRRDSHEKLIINNHHHDILHRYFSYYNHLSHEGKLKFLNRVSEFISRKKFFGMEGLEVKDEMKVLISASAIQLTFGLEKYLLEFFTTIRIYPRYFYSKLLKAELKGGASEAGVLMLSWEDFLLGYRHPHDNYNLGLHEMAHVLKINVLKGKDFDEKFSFYLDEWLKIGDSEFKKLKKRDKKSLLREYGGTNQHEFFAVCIEHFFENPDDFKEELPDIFNHLCFLLNQDPRNVGQDYTLREDFIEIINKNQQRVPIPKHLKEHYKYHNWHWAYSLMIAGIFVGITSSFILSSMTLIPIFHIVLFALIGVGLAFIIQYKFLVIRHQVFKPADFLLYAVFGIMPLVSGLFLFANYAVRVSYIEEIHPIEAHENRAGEVIVTLEGNAYADYPGIRSVSSKNYPYASQAKYLKLEFAEGVFGYKFLIDSEVKNR